MGIKSLATQATEDTADAFDLDIRIAVGSDGRTSSGLPGTVHASGNISDQISCINSYCGAGGSGSGGGSHGTKF